MYHARNFLHAETNKTPRAHARGVLYLRTLYKIKNMHNCAVAQLCIFFVSHMVYKKWPLAATNRKPTAKEVPERLSHQIEHASHVEDLFKGEKRTLYYSEDSFFAFFRIGCLIKTCRHAQLVEEFLNLEHIDEYADQA